MPKRPMCSYLPAHERARLEQAFRRLDRNGDGTITVREFKIACSQVNPNISEREVRNLVMDVRASSLILALIAAYSDHYSIVPLSYLKFDFSSALFFRTVIKFERLSSMVNIAILRSKKQNVPIELFLYF